ncbi:rho GTPase-activating protein conundrum-like [Cylas formicarius]|uniref:rho GTPase-activating protein conundrum-like n=1 Tax=Cylas formicarius TaxID=197179 RepID=UPI0029587C9A|nr:rho GTPase-activating protein conundrum-like [Cylas formicarius]XP_060515888.1 rho GTPase-activating protein conundrum-like [Cylas formicarius]XP_060515889.1 rho GTPase-activating protein conundrum-like [Cylas formicarius]
MESEEALRYYIDEVKDTQHDINNIVDEEYDFNEVEQATDFLQKAGLTNLSYLHQQGKEISENVLVNSVKQRNLTEIQTQTIRSRVATLNKTLRSRQPRRKHRQDVRDVAWNLETSSTGTRSRSATPDSLDSGDNGNSHHDDLTWDEEQQLTSLPHFSLGNAPAKVKVKWTSSEPWQSKRFSKNDKGDVAHLGSENVVLKGYQPLTESGSLTKIHRERSGSDPTTEIHLSPLKIENAELLEKPGDIEIVQGPSQVNTNHNFSRVYIHCNELNDNNGALSFEGLVKQNENVKRDILNSESNDGVCIDEFSDSEYQYLRPLLYVELIAIFDQYKIKYSKKKASNKTKGGNVFGVNLSTLVMRDMPRPTDNSMIPQIFQTVIDQLNARCLCEDGILRLAGQKQKLESLCYEIETKFYSNRKHVDNLLQTATAHELTGVLKKLIRDLPDPIFTMEFLDMFYKTGEIPNTEDRIKALNLLVLSLPIEHRNTFRILLDLLLNIIKHEAQNRMNLHNVAMIAAPSFFPPKILLPKDNRKLFDKPITKEELTKQINDAAVRCCIVENMFSAKEKLWTVPEYLAIQAREARKKKEKDKKLGNGKAKLVRSSTQYEPTARSKRDIFVK